MLNHPATYEEGIEAIEDELSRRRHKWFLHAVPSVDFDDVSQTIRIHIAKKWVQYDQSKPFRPWVNAIISSQMKNMLRNLYWNFERPCLRCPYNLNDQHCERTPSGEQCNQCPEYAKWEKTKKTAHNIKLPVSIENHQTEVHNNPDCSVDIEHQIEQLNVKLKETLKPQEWKVYDLLYIQNKDEADVAMIMGFKTNEANRQPGYKRIMQLKENILIKTKQILEEGL